MLKRIVFAVAMVFVTALAFSSPVVPEPALESEFYTSNL